MRAAQAELEQARRRADVTAYEALKVSVLVLQALQLVREVYMYVYMYVCMYVCMYLCMYVVYIIYIYECTYIYIIWYL